MDIDIQLAYARFANSKDAPFKKGYTTGLEILKVVEGPVDLWMNPPDYSYVRMFGRGVLDIETQAPRLKLGYMSSARDLVHLYCTHGVSRGDILSIPWDGEPTLYKLES